MPQGNVPGSRHVSHLSGDMLIHNSPCYRYQIWRAVLPTFRYAKAIVNATDQQLTLNTSVPPGDEFQIIRAAGNEFLEHLQSFGTSLCLPTGQAVTTPSFAMRTCDFLIHVNAPHYRTRTRKTLPLLRQQLADCYRRCLEEAELHGIRSIAFPCLSTGAILGWPRTVAARIGIDTVRRWFNHPIFGQRRKENIHTVYFLADPTGPYNHQEEAWLIAFNEFFPASEAPVPPKPRTTNLIRDLSQTGEALQRVRNRRTQVQEVPTLNREDAIVGDVPESEVESSSPTRKRKRAISNRELRDLWGDGARTKQLLEGSKKRERRPPRRFGQDE